MFPRLSHRVVWALLPALLLVTVRLDAQDQLVLLSPHWEGIRTEFESAFRAAHLRETGRSVDFKWLDVGGASDILKYIRSEYRQKPDGIGVDLFFGGGTDPYVELAREGMLAPSVVPDSILSGVAETLSGVPLRDPTGTWYAVTMAGFGIVYNKVVLSRLGLPEPATWEDLADPRVLSWVGSADPRKSGSVHMAYEIILQAYGWDRGWQILTAMGANVRGFSSNAAQTPKDVAIGEVAYGLAIDSYAWHQVREAGPEMIGFTMPEDLTVVNGDAIALLKGAPSPGLAERFVQFTLSEAGQKLLLLRLGEADGPRQFELGKFSVRPDLYAKVSGRTPVQLNPFAWSSHFEYDPATGSRRWAVVNDLIGSQIIDVHALLRDAWAEEIAAGTAPEAVGRLGRMPVTEAEAQRLAGRWRDATFRNETLAAWTDSARTRLGEHGSPSAARNVPAAAAALAGVAAYVYSRRKGRL